MKKSIVLLSTAIAVFALCVAAVSQTTWKLSKDLLATNNQISFQQGSNGVWYFLQSNSLAHRPVTYEFLPTYFEPCVSDSVSHFADGMACWQNPTLERGIYPIPLVGINATYASQSPNGAFEIPKRSVFMHPSNTGLAIIGWKSPLTGSVDISGFFSHLDQSCGDGVIWSVDIWTPQGNRQLQSGAIPITGSPQPFSIPGVVISTGQILYFVVAPNGADFCDTTGVDVTISKTK